MNLLSLREIAPQLNQIAQKHGIIRLYVFGSVARGDATSKSDVDFLVEMKPQASLFGAAGFGYEAEQLLNTRVDVVPISVLSSIEDKQFVSSICNDANAL
jgi:uncharacterized protein